MSAFPLAMRLATMMTVIVLLACALTVTLDALKFRRILRAQEDLVYGLVATTLGETIEAGTNLGLPFPALTETEQLLQRRRVAEHGVLGITVFDAGGTIRFDTDRFRVGSALPAAWHPPSLNAATWSADVEGAGLVASHLVSTIGQPVGGVVVRYDLGPLDTRMNAILLAMVRVAAEMVALSAVIAAIAATVLTRSYHAWTIRVAAGLAPDAATLPGAAAPPGTEHIIEAVRAAEAELDTVEHALTRLGAGAGGERPAAPGINAFDARIA